jgi:hypothetical protein
MKLVVKKKRPYSFVLKCFIGLSVVLFLVFFLLSLHFAGSDKKDIYPLQLSELISTPESSLPGGFYPEEFLIKLTSDNIDGQIYYTLDGSEPTIRSFKYDAPILVANRSLTNNVLSVIPTSPRWKPPLNNVFKGTILRAISVSGNKKSNELIQTFFIDEKGRQRYSFPVISIVMNNEDLFGYKSGIYVLGKSYLDKDKYIRKNIPLNLPWWEYPSNYLDKGSDAERRTHIEFFEPSGNKGFSLFGGIRINGNATRGFAQKSLRICFRKKYGAAALNYQLFASNPVETFNAFILRNSGNDWDKTMFRDAFMQSLMQNTNVDIQDYRPSVVFLNGEYWGIHNIRERFDENYLNNKYRISKDSITILELTGSVSYGHKREADGFSQLLDFVKQNDISVRKNYDFLKSKIDIESFSDFVIANLFFCNSDWPNNNVKFWRYNNDTLSHEGSVKDGRWRWMLYDTDWGFGYNTESVPTKNLLEKARKTGSIGILFNALIRNKDFVSQFTKRFQYLLNSSFTSSSMLLKIDQFQKELSPEISEHIARWRAIGSYQEWLKNIEIMKDFALKRPGIQAEQLNHFFELKGENQIIIKNK